MYFMGLLYFTEEDITNHSIKSAEQTSRIVVVFPSTFLVLPKTKKYILKIICIC